MPVLDLLKISDTGRLVVVFVAAVVGVGFAAGTVTPSSAAVPDVISLAEIEPGMVGYGLSVFAGSRVDTFAVTAIGIQENIRAAGSFLIVEVAGQGLEISSIAQGMSGSPIYFDGRFAGALSFGWSGALRPLAGVTPADEMLALPSRPQETAPRSPRSTPPRWSMLLPDAADGAGLAAEILGEGAGADPAPDAFWTRLDGWPAPEELAVAMLRRRLGAAGSPAVLPDRWIYRPVGSSTAASSGTSAAGPVASLVPGAACAVPLVTGDASLGAIGTVTWVDGDRVLLMGHPFMQRGPVNLPLAAAEILTVFPSRAMSFKIGTVGPVLGTVHHDQRAGLAGRLGAGPEMIPVEVSIATPRGDRAYRFDVVDDPVLTPILVFWSMYNAVLVEGDDASRQTVRYRMTSHWDGPSSLSDAPQVWSGVTAGAGGVANLGGELMAPLALLADNPQVPVRLRSVAVDLELNRPDALATIVGMSGPRSLPTGGGEVVFEIAVEPRLEDATTVTVPVAIPSHLPPGPYRVVAASAAELFALEAQRVAGAEPPRDLARMLELLNRDRSPGTLMLAIFAPGSGVVVGGQELPSLPGSVGRLLRAGNQLAGRSLADYVLRRARPTPWVLQGHAVRTMELRSGNEPVTEERRP